MFCKNCGTQLKDGELFCSNCGTKQEAQVVKSVAKEEKKPNFKPKKKSKGKTGIIIIALVVIIAIVASVFAFPKIKEMLTPSANATVCYVKDGELYVNFSGDLTSQQLTKKMLIADLNSEELASAGSYSYQYSLYCPEANRIFFPDRLEENDVNSLGYTDGFGMNLYYADLDEVGKESFEPIKIDSRVAGGYQVTEDGNKVYYRNVDDGALYCNNLETKVKIADKVNSFYVNSDASIVIYTTYSDNDSINLYSIDSDGKSKEIAKDISIKYNSEDHSIIYYQQKNTLFSLANGETIKEILKVEGEDTYISVIYADVDGNVYYTMSGDVERPKAISYINDDLAEKDAAIIEPDSSNKDYWKSWTQYKIGDEIVSEYAKEYTDEYYNLLEAYTEKQERDELREELKDLELYISTRTLYCFDGKGSKKISDNITYDTTVSDGMVIFSREDIENAGKINFSEICSSIEELDGYSARNYVEEKITANLVYYAIINNSVVEMVSGTELSSVKINSDKSAVCYIQKSQNELCGDLYKVDVNGGGLSEPIKLYNMVGAYDIIDNKDVVYYRDPILVNSEDGIVESDLYINDTKIDSGVVGAANSNFLSIRYLSDGTIFYGTNQINSYTFTLKQFDGKETKAIAADIALYVPVAKDKVYFVDNFRTGSYTGDLKFIDGEEIVKITSDVSNIYFPMVKALDIY